MYTDDYLRNKVKLMKALGTIGNYIEIAELIDVKKKSFYNWLRGEYSFGDKKRQLLSRVIDDMWIDDINLYI